jgi:hypothetical protein
MILTHESGSQEDQFDEKKWRQKISWDYPFKPNMKVSPSPLRLHTRPELNSYVLQEISPSFRGATKFPCVTITSQLRWKIAFQGAC